LESKLTKLTTEEINAIIQMMDIATKAGGLQVAQQALPIAVKLQAMAQEEAKPVEDG
jgi:hypothetical protein